MVYSALSDDSNTISQFTRRKAITVTTGGTNIPADYQVKLTITYESEMQADFDDIRFNTLSRTYVDYWIESYIASTSAIVWIKLSDAITDPGSDYIWIYYGNPGLSDGGDGNDTFQIFNDGTALTGFNSAGASSVGGKIVIAIHATGVNFLSSSVEINRPSILEYDLTLTGYFGCGGLWTDETVSPDYFADNHIGFYFAGDGNFYWLFRDTVGESVVNLGAPGASERHIKILWGTTISDTKLYIDDVLKTTPAGNFPSSTHLHFNTGGRSGTSSPESKVDNVFVRKYIANEPTPSYGTAQHQRRVPQFIG